MVNFNFLNKIFKSEAKIPTKVELPKAKDFKVLTDPNTGITKMEQKFLQDDKTYNMVRTETRVLPDGTKEITTKVYGLDRDGKMYVGGDQGLRTSRTKTIKVEDGASAFDGKKITVDKKYDETMSETAHDVHLEKHYSKDGTLEHLEGTKKYRHWDTPQTATIDKVYSEANLPHSENELFNVSPTLHGEYKHKINSSSNYHQFADEGTKYTRTIEAKEQAIKKAEEEKLVAELAAKEATEKAKAELKASRPRINVGKALNKNIEDLEVHTQTLKNGTVERIYTEPDSDKVIIKTQDLGKAHREWIYGGKADLVFMKQYGEETPYIVAKKGNYTQVKGQTWHEKPEYRRSYEKQYYYDGQKSYIDDGGNQYLRMPYNETQYYKDMSDDMKAAYDRSVARGYDHKLAYQTSDHSSTQGIEFREVSKEAQAEKMDLTDLYKPYEK